MSITDNRYNTSDIAALTAANLGIKQELANDVLQEALDVTSELVVNGHKVLLAGLATVEAVERAPRRHYNIATGLVEESEASVGVRFNASRVLRDRLKELRF